MTKQRNNRRTCCTWRISRHQIILQSFTAKKRCSISKTTQVDHFYTSVYVLEASRDFDHRTTCILWVFFCLVLFFFSPSTWIVYENAATMFYCEATKMFCGQRNFTWLSISTGMRGYWLNFRFWVNLSFKLGFTITLLTQTFDSQK